MVQPPGASNLGSCYHLGILGPGGSSWQRREPVATSGQINQKAEDRETVVVLGQHLE